jgi:hypothetical protein
MENTLPVATVTVALAGADVPSAPVQVSVKVVVFVRETLCVPLVAFVPVQPPLAVQEVALVLDQVRVELLPGSIVVGIAVSVTVGTAAAVTVTVALVGEVVPPAPEQVSE